MSITTERKNLSLNKCSIKESITEWIEQDIIVPDSKPDALKIVNITAYAYVTDCEVMDDKVKVTGKMNYYIIYRCNENNMVNRGLNVCFPYTQVLNVKGANKNMDAYVVPTVRNVIHSLPNERKISTKTEVLFKVTLRIPANVSLICKFECDDCIECKKQKDCFNNIMKYKSSIIASKEDIMLPKENEDFFEILKVSTKLINTEYKESFNKIMVKGDIEVLLMYLSETETDNIKNVNLTVPFSGMIEVDSITDKSNFTVKHLLQDFSIKPNLEITTTKTMTVEYQIETIVTMFERSEVEYISDFYSQTRELEYDEEVVDVVRNTEIYVKTFDIKETVRNILSENNRLVEYSIDTSYVIAKVIGNSINLDGNIKANFMIVNMDSQEMETKSVDILVNEEYVIDEITDDSKAYVNIYIDKAIVNTIGNDIEVKVILKSEVEAENTVKLNIVDKVNQKDITDLGLDSMNIYIVKPKDTLWTIAKKYKTSVNKIVGTNDISDENKIDVGQKILIIR